MPNKPNLLNLSGMNIVLLADRIPPENRGGAGEIVWRLAQGLHAQGHTVSVIVASEKASFTQERDGITTYHLHSHYHPRWRAYLSLVNPQVIPALKTLLTRLKPDVVNAHNIHTDISYYALRVAHRMGIRTVFTSHDVMPFAYTKLSHFITPNSCDVPASAYRLPFGFNLRQNGLRYNPVRNWVIRHILRHHADVRLAVSHELAKAHEANGLPPFEVLHNGIDVHQWQADDAHIHALRTRLGLEGRKIILFAGRLTNAKGMAQLLQALTQVIVHVPNVALLVLSPSPLEQQVTSAQLSQLKDIIVSGGWLTGAELVSAYHLATVIVAPSIIFDSFPTVILEAMASGKPTIATCFGGGKEAFIDNQHGFILNPYQTDDFAEKLMRLLTDERLAQHMGASATQHVTQHFGMGAWLQRLLAIYDRR
jgi:glycosyltransferase involved in cell wall biosynthesis